MEIPSLLINKQFISDCRELLKGKESCLGISLIRRPEENNTGLTSLHPLMLVLGQTEQQLDLLWAFARNL